MMHATVDLLEKSTHRIHRYIVHMARRVAWPGTYTESDKHPAPENGMGIQD